MATGIEIVDKYTRFYLKKLRNQGFDVTAAQVQSEVGLAYAKAIDGYKRRGNKPQQASFETYAIQAIKNQINTMRRDIIQGSRRMSTVQLDENMADCKTAQPDCEVRRKSAARWFLGQFADVPRLLVKELIDPSEKVVRMLEAYNAKHQGCSSMRGAGPAIYPEVIALVYDLDPTEVRNTLSVIRNTMRRDYFMRKMQKALDLSAKV